MSTYFQFHFPTLKVDFPRFRKVEFRFFRSQKSGIFSTFFYATFATIRTGLSAGKGESFHSPLVQAVAFETPFSGTFWIRGFWASFCRELPNNLRVLVLVTQADLAPAECFDSSPETSYSTVTRIFCAKRWRSRYIRSWRCPKTIRLEIEENDCSMSLFWVTRARFALCCALGLWWDIPQLE